eukprot:gene4754-3919_t
MVATNGQHGGTRDNILLWSSADLVHWSTERELPVMAKYKEDMANLWAPEWVWDA